MTRLALLALACSFDPAEYSAHVPSDPDCGRVAVAEYSAADECVRLEDTNGRTLFRLSDSASCGGPPCIVLEPGQVGYALEKTKPGERAEWSVEAGACDALADCCGEYLGSFQCWR